ncbi:hypothetical protein CPB84DRAFT_1843407 [Gymnopilus junonius]|uniref:Uncharacterized protein n=1 Tax=Gymnopilus junonius TaxID=109634 RepID=A0A9P5NX89_GYMJU|nr:hypothetical protein CPB84DRAFT_1843407 [Gymnopilus junonius]
MSQPINIRAADLPGLTSVLVEAAASRTFRDDIVADLEEEQATLPSKSTLFDENENNDSDEEEDDNDDDNDLSKGGPMDIDDDHTGGMPSEWKSSMKEASKGVTDKTHNEYLRLASACAEFLMANNLISDPDEFLSSTPLPDSDQMIVAWIMDS